MREKKGSWSSLGCYMLKSTTMVENFIPMHISFRIKHKKNMLELPVLSWTTT
jgi:hypothetical protein